MLYVLGDIVLNLKYMFLGGKLVKVIYKCAFLLFIMTGIKCQTQVSLDSKEKKETVYDADWK
jgi:hypothetical protein